MVGLEDQASISSIISHFLTLRVDESQVHLRAVKKIKDKLQPIEQQLAEIESKASAGAPSLVQVDARIQEVTRLCAQNPGSRAEIFFERCLRR